jgi:excisionase family DNA binding protein
MMSKFVFSIAETSSIVGIGRTSLYEAIHSGALRAIKRGRRTLILRSDLLQWMESLPEKTVKVINQAGNQEGK